MKMAAVVVTFNRKDLLRQCLQALLAQTRSLDEIIVVDNASTDGTDKMVSMEFPQVTYIRLPENTGGAGGFHEGMKLAYEKGYDWIWVMDDDAFPIPNALECLLRAEQLKDENVYVLASAVLDPNGDVCIIHRRVFIPAKNKEQPVPLDFYRMRHFEVDTVSFVGALIRRQAIEKFGLPIKEFFIYYDDTEYSLRLRKKGYKIVTIPNSKVIHGTEKKTCTNSRRDSLNWRFFYGHRNMIYTYKRYGLNPFKLFLRILVLTLRTQAGIILFRKDKINGSKILWKGTIDGFIGRLGKYERLH